MNTPVSFPLAELAIQKGFDKECKEYWNLIEYSTEWIVEHRINPDSVDFMYAPTIADVCMWLYEKYMIWISVDPDNDINNTWFHTISHGTSTTIFGNYRSPTEAYEAGIEDVLINMI